MYLRQKQAASVLEYTLLVMVILSAVLVTQKYVVRGFAGRWKQMGDSFGLGKQYDPRKTIECTYSDDFNTWYDKDCYERDLKMNYPPCYSGCFNSCEFPDPMTPHLCENPNSDGCGCVSCNYFSMNCQSYEPNCCDRGCKTRCTGTTSNASMQACTMVGNIDCNAAF